MMFKVYNIFLIGVFGLLLVPISALSEIHQCKDNGKTIFQQTPCENETEVICNPNVDYSETNLENNKYCYRKQVALEKELIINKKKHAEKQRKSGYLEKLENVNNALEKAENNTLVGMSLFEFKKVWRDFEYHASIYSESIYMKSNVTKSIYGDREQIILHIGDRRKYFYFQDDTLTTISD